MKTLQAWYGIWISLKDLSTASGYIQLINNLLKSNKEIAEVNITYGASSQRLVRRLDPFSVFGGRLAKRITRGDASFQLTPTESQQIIEHQTAFHKCDCLGGTSAQDQSNL